MSTYYYLCHPFLVVVVDDCLVQWKPSGVPGAYQATPWDEAPSEQLVDR